MKSTQKILHIIPKEKFTKPYIDFVNNNFDRSNHSFLVTSGVNYVNIDEEENVKILSNHYDGILTMLKSLNKMDKVILHSLGGKKLLLALFFQPWILKKCNWVIWGGDLYYYKYRQKSLKSNVYEFMRKQVIKNLGGLITPIKGDYELARKWYGAKGDYYYSFVYPSNLYKEYNIPNTNQSNTKIIQIGNSATQTNNHLEVFEKLKLYKNEDIKIICPLSYGDSHIRNIVIKRGKEIFSDKFIPIIDFMPYNEYLNLLSKVDIAIFNHDRQQAIGNMITLLGLGKKVYIRDDITTWDFCKEHNLKVFNISHDRSNLLDDFSDIDKQVNIENIKTNFSIEKLYESLNYIFEG